MQLPSDTTLAAAVDSADRMIVHKLEMDWPGGATWDLTPWVIDASCNRMLDVDLPAEATRSEGHVAAELSVTLGGDRPSDGLSALEALAPYRSAGQPLLTAPIRWDIGFAGTAQVRQFTGTVRSIDADSRSGRVEIKALDLADQLRAPITLPTYAMSRSDILNSGHRFFVNTQGIVDFILRKNGVYASPPAHPQAEISCTGHGILASEAGHNAVPRGVCPQVSDLSWFIDGPFDMLAVRGMWTGNTTYQEFFSRHAYVPYASNGLGIGAWVYFGTPNSYPVGETRVLFETMPLVSQTAWRFQLYLTASGSLGGVIEVGGVDVGYVQPITTPEGWMYVGLHFQHRSDGTTRIQYRQNATTTQGDITTPALTSPVASRMQMAAWTFVPWCNMQVWYDGNPPTGDWPGETHTPQASIGKGVNELFFLPDVTGQESLSVLKEAIQAEYGLFQVSEHGVASFIPRSESIDPTTVDKTVTADRALIDLGAQTGVDSIRNIIELEATAGTMDFAKSILVSRDALEFQAPTGVWDFDVTLPHGAVSTTSQVLPQIVSASWTDSVLWGFVAVRQDSPATEIPSGVSVTFTATGDRQGRLRVRNYSAFPVRFATTGGQPALRVQGWALTYEPPELAQYRAEGSIAQFGERSFKVPPSVWRQFNQPLEQVAGGLLSTLSQPMPLVKSVSIVGDPRLQLGDCLRFVDPQGQGLFRAYLVGLTQRLEPSGLTSDLIVRPVAPPGVGILDDTELGLLDSTLILAP